MRTGRDVSGMNMQSIEKNILAFLLNFFQNLNKKIYLLYLGKLDLTDEGLWRRDELVVRNCIRRGIPVSTVIGGGYDRNIEILAARYS